MFAFKVAKTANVSQIYCQCCNNCSKCLLSAFTQARRRFLKFAINLQTESSGTSYSQEMTSVPGCPLAADSGERTSQALLDPEQNMSDLVAMSLCQQSGQ